MTDASARPVGAKRPVGAARATGTVRAADGGHRPIGTVRAALRGWRVFVPAVAVYAGLQYLLILPDVTPAVTPLFLVLVAVAYLLDVALVAASSVGASAAARGLTLAQALPRGIRSRRLVTIVGWSALWVVVVAFTALLNAIIAGVLLLVGAAVMPAIVAGRGVGAWFRPLRRLPVRTVAWGLLSYLALIVSAVADAELGFLVGGPVGAACARVVAGVIGVLILCSSAVLAERAEAARAASSGASVRG